MPHAASIKIKTMKSSFCPAPVTVATFRETMNLYGGNPPSDE